jgi:hypothetical protein
MKIELTVTGSAEEVIEALKRISDGIQDAIESDEDTDILLDGVDNEIWDIENTKFNISC